MALSRRIGRTFVLTEASVLFVRASSTNWQAGRAAAQLPKRHGDAVCHQQGVFNGRVSMRTVVVDRMRKRDAMFAAESVACPRLLGDSMHRACF